MRIDLHNHTVLCNHATGTIEEYLQKAISLGIDIYGFSEHAPMKNFEDGYRLTLDNINLYKNEVLHYKEKYKDDINLLLGYEVDYIDDSYLLDEIIKDDSVDYLVGSVHYLDKWGFDNPEFIEQYQSKDIDTIWQEYFEAVYNMVQSGYFNIVGHLDLIKVFKFLPKKDIKSIAYKTIKAIKKANIAVEINSAGFRKPIREQYPSKELLELCFEADIPITFSSDAHSVEQVGFEYDKSKKLALEVGYTKAVYFQNKQMIEVDI